MTPAAQTGGCATGAASAPSSYHLTAAIAGGDEDAFSTFYEIWFDRVYAMARSVTHRDESSCLDIVQDCMLRVVKRIGPLGSEAAVGAWLAKTLFRVAVDHLRRDRRRAQHERAVAEQTAPVDGRQPALALLDAEQATWLQERLAELPATDRRLMAERFEHGKTLDAVGAGLGMSGHAAHGRIWRIVARLRGAAVELFHD